MDKEQVIKLINLANSNPNDNEANSAARSVCRLLEDYSFPDEPPVMLDPMTWCLRHHKPRIVCRCGY